MKLFDIVKKTKLERATLVNINGILAREIVDDNELSSVAFDIFGINIRDPVKVRGIKFFQIDVSININEKNHIRMISGDLDLKEMILFDKYFIGWSFEDINDLAIFPSTTKYKVENKLEFDELLDLFNISLDNVKNKIHKRIFSEVL